jgi:hypothetical protein
VIGILFGCHVSFGGQSIHGRLHCLARQAHAPGDLGHGQRLSCQDYRSEHLPSGRDQTLGGSELIPRDKQASVGAKRSQDDFRRGLTFSGTSTSQYAKSS